MFGSRWLHRHRSPTPPEMAELRTLRPFAQAPDAMLQLILGSVRVIELPVGPWQPDASSADLHFLRHGRLTLVAPNGESIPLTADMAPSRYPLPTAAEARIHATAAAQLLRIPERFLQLVQTQAAAPDAPLQAHVLAQDEDIAERLLAALRRGTIPLPSLPDLALRLGRALDDPRTDNPQLARLIQTDPALATRLLGVVNSVAIAGVRRIDSLPQAIARLGRNQVRSLAMSCLLQDLFSTRSTLLRQRMHRLWQSSCRVAAIAMLIARHTPGLNPERGLLAGLLHEIGVVAILSAAQHEEALREDAHLLERVVGLTRVDAGTLILTHWRFDQDLLEVVRHAHHWHHIGTALPSYADAVILARLHHLLPQRGALQLPRIDALPAWEKLMLGRLTPRHSLALLEGADQEIGDLARLLGGFH